MPSLFHILFAGEELGKEPETADHVHQRGEQENRDVIEDGGRRRREQVTDGAGVAR